MPKLNAHDRRRVAVVAVVDDRTVGAFLNGRPVRCTSAARISAALASLGLTPSSGTSNPAPASPG